MKELLASWEGLCVSSAILRFVDINLRGTGRSCFRTIRYGGCWRTSIEPRKTIEHVRFIPIRYRCIADIPGNAFGVEQPIPDRAGFELDASCPGEPKRLESTERRSEIAVQRVD